MNTHLTAHPNPTEDRLVTGAAHDFVTLKFGAEVTVILPDRDPEAAEAWLLDASQKLADLARKVAVRAAIKATA